MRTFGVTVPARIAASVALGALACSQGTSGPRNTCDSVPASAQVAAWTADPHFCLIRYADAVPGARQIAFAPNGDLFVGGAGRVAVVYDANRNGISEVNERATFAAVPGGNHSVILTATHVYASSETTVYRWPYRPGQRTSSDAPEIVVQQMPAGGHAARTLLIDGQNRLYVNVGSATNVDATTGTTPPQTRALLLRFDLQAIPAGGHLASAGERFALGVRNEVGLTLDSAGRIWGVENGRDDLGAGGPDGGPGHYDNPAEEVNLFDPARPGLNYGYPFCWSEGLWTNALAKGPGTQHVDVAASGFYTEAMCQNPAVVVPPVVVMRAHLAPLDIVEYQGAGYPAELKGNFFVASHGSWNRENGQVGRLIIRLRTTAGTPTAAENFLGELDAGTLREGMWSVRPVSIRVDPAGLLTFSDDMGGAIYKIGYRP